MKHSNEKFLCSQCPKVCNSKEHLRTHERSSHFAKREFPCPECDKIFDSRANLMTHKVSVHVPDEEKPFRCE